MRINDVYQFAILMGVAILYCAPVGARGSFGEGIPSKITQYILRNKYAKFGALDWSVMIKTITDRTMLQSLMHK